MRKGLSIYSLIALILLMLAVIGTSAVSPYIEVKLLPIIIASIVILLAAIQLFREAARKVTIQATGENESLDSRRSMYESIWILGFLAVIYIAGFLIAIPVFILSYLKVHGRPWRRSIALAVLVTGLIYLVFVMFLGTHIYQGLILDLINKELVSGG